MAGGRGERLGGETKQFRSLGGHPVACWAARALLSSLGGVVVVVLPGDEMDAGPDRVRAHLEEDSARLRFAAGGARRQDSVRAGLDAIAGEAPGAVLVHDAVRPFASPALVRRIGAEAGRGRSVVPALPAADTLKRVDGDRVVETLDRSLVVAVQTPQGFPFELLSAAHAAWPEGEEATDDAAVCERFGAAIAWVPGEPANRKLTDPDDWWWAERIVESGRVTWEGTRP
ncbi:MAG TPA: 2-C-methyl-D-erythritol 4-phosphate cytidylyltransferase [Gemmatimonadota bacterium]|nr:2-C-methyl-D-erythritol 4-phosphate cytidylyltransferase [Gemmatimonadota bacterium]